MHYRAGCLLALATGAALSAPLRLPGIDASPPVAARYRCDQGSLRVMYYNTHNGQSFALLPVAGRVWLFVQTLSASGVRYQAGQYVWWTKGEDGNLYDERRGANAAPMIGNCHLRAHR
jgi:membrane-bound inhibitor of C-type lysozyme